jgi:hypothetical protein
MVIAACEERAKIKEKIKRTFFIWPQIIDNLKI